MANAAIYLRSSKDRSDVSIASQRRELATLAKRDGYAIVAEYSDTVESAKDEFRPQFQKLLQDMRAPGRNWDALLTIDTSRISRRTYFAHAFRHEAAKRGVRVVYAKLPGDLDPISEVIIYSTLTAMDEVHSLMSREKGLAGMAENVRSGWRAGGRAPFGYKLFAVGTGAIRDGHEVSKTRLEPNESATQAGRYLRARAHGATRRDAIAQSGIDKSVSTLVGIEWNAFTYAGANVWNVHAEKLPEGGYRGASKRRPRADWIIQRDTHPALIEWDEAEQIVSRLESSDIGRAVSQAKTGGSAYLLTGLLVSPDGAPWYGHRHTHYRYRPGPGARGRTVLCSAVDELVLDQIASDIGGQEFITAMAEAARNSAAPDEGGLKDIHAQITSINHSVDRAMQISEQLEDPAPALRRIDALERERQQLAALSSRMEKEQRTAKALSNVTEKDIKRALETAAEEMRNTEPAKLKPALRSLIDRVELDPNSLETTIHYKITADMWPSMASPRGFEPLLPP